MSDKNKVSPIAALRRKVSALQRETEALRLENDRLIKAMEQLQTPTIDYNGIASDSDFIERYAVNSPKLTEAIIRQYLLGLANRNGVNVLSTSVGSPPLTPQRKPKSLAEAKKLADIIIKG